MYVYIWRYRVHPEALDDFLRHYGPDGEWARLFRTSPHYKGTTLLRDTDDSNIFATIDSWENHAHYEEFLEAERSGFENLDERCEGFTEWERRVGSFVSEDGRNEVDVA